MAKYGEGDKRWIVEDRADGANVHNWHWAETDCLDWSRTLLTNLLSNLNVLDGESDLFISTKTVSSVSGEAYVNVRKGKVIPGYEISLSLPWEGEARDPATGATLLKVEGAIEIPYIADENHDEDPEVKVTVKDDGPIGRTLKDAFLKKGKPLILEKVRVFVEAMAKGGPAKGELEAKKKKNTNSTNSINSAEEETKKSAAAAPPRRGRRGRRGRSNARISKEVRGEFSLFDGAVTGMNQELQEGKLIVQKWRFSNWADGIHSTVRIALDEPESGFTVVKLTQTGVPEEDRYGNSTVVENTERGWRDLIFNKIRAVFGFGI
ncbi:hypothetical protein Syun_002119 [Stephania yunnanensis]|uniref:Activator of Hsp90 ATPase AHSA1-like N-terminal domain-containing protein n=1 Tax=Stephania yunnanensis TaxID=152371 RepID=A0AAP0LJ61_9MAGN